MVAYFGKRKNVVDSDYLLVEDADVLLDNIKSVYTLRFRIEALRILEKYNVDYIVFSTKTKEKYKVEEISYIDNPCFTLIYNQSVKIYKRNTEICKQELL